MYVKMVKYSNSRMFSLGTKVRKMHTGKLGTLQSRVVPRDSIENSELGEEKIATNMKSNTSKK